MRSITSVGKLLLTDRQIDRSNHLIPLVHMCTVHAHQIPVATYM